MVPDEMMDTPPIRNNYAFIFGFEKMLYRYFFLLYNHNRGC